MNKGLKGALIASAVASLFLTGQAMADHHEGNEGKTKCSGINGCKGQGKCGGAGHSCAGQNACKGQGWVYVDSAAKCTEQGGKVVD